MTITNALRAALLELINNPSKPAISAEDAARLIELRFATRWANTLAITRAGRLAAFPPTSGGPTP
ncbi:MAG: hypothetical protein ACXWI8_21720, partial [Burkholderiales bacterium]